MNVEPRTDVRTDRLIEVNAASKHDCKTWAVPGKQFPGACRCNDCTYGKTKQTNDRTKKDIRNIKKI